MTPLNSRRQPDIHRLLPLQQIFTLTSAYLLQHNIALKIQIKGKDKPSRRLSILQFWDLIDLMLKLFEQNSKMFHPLVNLWHCTNY